MNGVRPTMRGRVRYDWWRAHHGLPQHAKWRAVAREAGVPVSVVFHIAVCLLDLASRASPRGSIADFKPFDCAAVVDVPVTDVAKVVTVLHDIHWVEGNRLAEWDERQPQREDAHAAARKEQQRHASSRNVTHGHAEQGGDVTHGHASSRNQSVTMHETLNVTKIAAPDRDKDNTTTTSVAAREQVPFSRQARSLASAPPAGALAREPATEPGAKRPSDVSRQELEQRFAARKPPNSGGV